jgi:hypothetical protein
VNRPGADAGLAVRPILDELRNILLSMLNNLRIEIRTIQAKPSMGIKTLNQEPVSSA